MNTESKTTFRYGLHFKEGYVPTSSIKSRDHLHQKTKHSYQKVKNFQKERFLSIVPTQVPIVHGGKHKPTTNTVAVTNPVVVTNQVPVKRALLIGINYFGTGNQLNGCIKDVQNIYNLLTTKFNYKPENIKILSDDQQGEYKPTKTNIIDNINTIVAMTKPGDELFMHYSGHGTQVSSTNDDEDLNPDASGKDDALCPCDFDDYNGVDGFIVDDELKEILVNKIPIGAKFRAFFDCCHSGTALDLPFLYRLGDYYTQVEPLDKESTNCLLISGCKDNQTSADAYINGQYSGALTWAILKALDSDLQTKITWKEFLLIVQHSLCIKKYTQIPMLSLGDQSLADLAIDL